MPKPTTAQTHTPEPWEVDDRGNAHLIAAAPDLLEALKAVLPQLEWANIHGSRCEELLGITRTAIAKATEGRE